MAIPHRFWLVKSEPDCFSIEHLAKSPNQTTCWNGVRNYQARNFMRDQMQVGDRVLYYHSSANPPAVAGVAQVAKPAYADHTAWDPLDDHFDPKASPENPIWQMVDLKLVEIFPVPVPINALRGVAGLKDMELLKQGSRLSVQPVRPQEFTLVLDLAKRLASAGASPKATKSPAAMATKTKSVGSVQSKAVQAKQGSGPGKKTPAKSRTR